MQEKNGNTKDFLKPEHISLPNPTTYILETCSMLLSFHRQYSDVSTDLAIPSLVKISLWQSLVSVIILLQGGAVAGNFLTSIW